MVYKQNKFRRGNKQRYNINDLIQIESDPREM